MRIWRRLSFWLGSRQRAEDIAAEMEDHRARLQAAYEADGLAAADAAARSRRAMGNITLAREDARDVWISAAFERVWRDAVYAARALRREPTFALAAIATLALGALTTITVVSVVNAELWKPLPFRDARQLVVAEVQHAQVYDGESQADLRDWNRGSRLARYTAADAPARHVLQRDHADSVIALPVASDFFQVIGLAPQLGRPLEPGDERERAVVLSDAGWRRLFAADPGVVGHNVQLDGDRFTIVGVLANAPLEFTKDPDFFVPIRTDTAAAADPRVRTLSIYGRISRGVPITRAEAEVQAIATSQARLLPQREQPVRVHLQDLQSYFTGFNWRELYFFLGAAGLVLLLACLNVSSLLAARALRRQREFAIRAALGGGTAALIRQTIVEGALIAVPGVMVGLTGAAATIRAFVATIPSGQLERGGNIHLDPRVALFTIALGTILTLVLAMAPLAFARRVALNAVLAQSGRATSASRRQHRLRRLLLTAQVTATLVLLAGAALFVVSFDTLAHTPLGFEPTGRVALRVAPPDPNRADDAYVARLSARLEEAIAAVPGVAQVALASAAPLDGRGGPAVQVSVPGTAAGETPNDGAPHSVLVSAGPAYFTALGIPVLDGRPFSRSDRTGAPRVCIINDRLARQLFPNSRAVGRTIVVTPRALKGWTSNAGPMTVVGVVGNVKNFAISEVDFTNIYLPYWQAAAAGPEIVVRTSVPAASIADALRQAVHRVDPLLPIAALMTMNDRARESLAGARFHLALILVFAALGLLLAAVGVYGSMACSMQERTREFGIRIALGAVPRAILGEALRESVRVGLSGAVLGTFAVVVLARVLGNALYLVPGQHGGLLYGIGMTDPRVLAATGLVLIGVATLAGLIPARQATRVDPLVVLRAD